VIEDRFDGDVFTLTVAAASGARASISFGPDGGSISATLRPAASIPPGRCLPIPQLSHHVYVTSSGIDNDGEFHESVNRWLLDTFRGLDVDGDGIDDAFVPIAPNRNACPEEVSYRVYVVRGNCGHDLGVVGPGSVTPNPSTPLARSGYRPIVMQAEVASHKHRIPDLYTTTRRFEVRGRRYKLVKQTRTGGQCHHCSTWSCHHE
jgi:hypothetical protein